MLVAQARQQLLQLLPRLLSGRVLQASASTTVALAQSIPNLNSLPEFALESFPLQPAAAFATRSSSSSSKGQQLVYASSCAMSAPAAASVEGYDSQWVEHWKQGVSPGQVRAP
jgi:hypothetical protein